MNNISKSILGGIIGTALMTMVMFIAPMMGMPKMSPPDMLAGMMGMPIIVGWLMHFMIGVIFALAYTNIFASSVKIENIYLKGAVFGLAVFIFAQIAMVVMGAVMPMPKPEGSMMMLLIGSLMGHIVFGMGVSKTVNQ